MNINKQAITRLLILSSVLCAVVAVYLFGGQTLKLTNNTLEIDADALTKTAVILNKALNELNK